jgi:predicted enzyme related to lactoylglutathione lyase
MAHRSRLGTLVIDCEGGNLAEAMRFWSGALGSEFHPDPDNARYAVSDTPAGQPHVVLHLVDHPSRVHLDIETDDREAERARLEAAGATLVERHSDGFLVMQAPTGQRFCLVGPQRDDFPGDARQYA